MLLGVVQKLGGVEQALGEMAPLPKVNKVPQMWKEASDVSRVRPQGSHGSDTRGPWG